MPGLAQQTSDACPGCPIRPEPGEQSLDASATTLNRLCPSGLATVSLLDRAIRLGDRRVAVASVNARCFRAETVADAELYNRMNTLRTVSCTVQRVSMPSCARSTEPG